MSDRTYKHIIWTGVVFLLAALPVLRGAVRPWSVLPAMFLITLLVFMWLWRASNHEGYGFRRTSLDLPVVLFVLLAGLSIAFSVYRHDSICAFLRLLCYAGVYYLIVNNFDRGMVKSLTLAIILTGAALSVYGLLQYAAVLPHPWWHPARFLSSTYVNHNHFSGYLEMVIPLAIGVLISRWRDEPVAGIVIGGALLAMSTAFVLAQSRGAWISLAISLVVMAIALMTGGALKKKSVFLVFFLILLVCAFIFIARPEVYQRLNTITGAETGEASLETRIKIWQGAVRMINDKPLTGTGIGTFAWSFPAYRPPGMLVRAYFTHNDYLQVASEMGLPALAVMLWIFLAAVFSGFTKGDPVMTGCAAGVLSVAIHGIVDFNFHIPANMLLCTVLIAIIMRGSLKKRSSSGSSGGGQDADLRS